MGYETSSGIVHEYSRGATLTQAGLVLGVAISANVVGMPNAIADGADPAPTPEQPFDEPQSQQQSGSGNDAALDPVPEELGPKVKIDKYFEEVLQSAYDRDSPPALIPLPPVSNETTTAGVPMPELPPAPASQPAPAPPVEPAPPVQAADNDPNFTFPVITTQQALIDRPVDDRWCYASAANCHHDYNAADIMVPPGTQVVSPVEGTVIQVVDDGVSEFGSNVTVRSSADQSIFYLTHMEDDSISVEEGQVIQQGTPLGIVGTENDAGGTSPHSHIDNLPPEYDYRVQCSGAECSPYPFRPIQERLIQAFLMLPENNDVPLPAPEPAPQPVPAPTTPPVTETPQVNEEPSGVPALIPLPGAEWRPNDTQPTVVPASIPLPSRSATQTLPPALESVSEMVTLNESQIQLIDSLGLSAERRQFVSDLVLAALNMRANGISVNPEAMVAQAIVESGWGESGLSANYNNFFGMKAREGTPPEQYVTLPTTEYRPDGSTYRIDANFLRFDSVQAGLEGYVEFISTRDWFADALQHPNDPSAYIDALMNGEKRWATDPAYKNTLMNMVNNLRLSEIITAA